MLVFGAMLFAFSAVGLVARVRSPDTPAAQPCAMAAEAAVRFQSNVTRDLRDHARLHADAASFGAEVRSLGAGSCSQTRTFLRSAETIVGSLCGDCLSGLHPRSSDAEALRVG